MSALLVILGFIALCWFLGWVDEKRSELRVLYPQAYHCTECRAGYSDPRVFSWHRQAAHPNTFDFGRAPNAVHRRRDADRDSAGENPDGEDARELGSRPWPHETKARRHFSRGGSR